MISVNLNEHHKRNSCLIKMSCLQIIFAASILNKPASLPSYQNRHARINAVYRPKGLSLSLSLSTRQYNTANDGAGDFPIDSRHSSRCILRSNAKVVGGADFCLF